MIDKLRCKIESNRLVKNFFTLLFGSGIGSIFGMLNLAIMIKTIGAEGNGTIIMIQTYVTLFYSIFSFKSFEGLIKYLSVTLNNKDYYKSKQYIKFSLFLDIFSGILAIIFAYIFLDWGIKIMGWSNNLRPYIIIYILTLLFASTGTFVGIIRIYNKYSLMVKSGIILIAIKFIFYFIGLIFKLNFNYYFSIEFIFNILNNIIIFIIGLKVLYDNNLINFLKSKFKFEMGYFKFNLYISLYTTIDIPVQQITTLIINKYLGFSEVSIYTVFQKIASIVLKIEAPLSQIIYPEMNLRFAKGNIKSAVNLYKKLFKIIFYVGLALIAFISITYKYWAVYFINDYKSYFISMIIYMIYIVYTAASRSIHDLFITLGYVKYNIYILIIVNTIYLLLLYSLIKIFSLNGVIFVLFLQAFMVIKIKKYIMRDELKIT
ncbi:lipopolysaccharide biosynthesis protein [Clostridium perfringens]